MFTIQTNRENRVDLTLSKQVPSTQANGREASAMASVSRPGTMEPSTVESGERIEPMAKAASYTSMETFTMDIGLMTRPMGAAFTNT